MGIKEFNYEDIGKLQLLVNYLINVKIVDTHPNKNETCVNVAINKADAILIVFDINFHRTSESELRKMEIKFKELVTVLCYFKGVENKPIFKIYTKKDTIQVNKIPVIV